MRNSSLVLMLALGGVLVLSAFVQAAIDPAGLIGYWKFDDQAGSTMAADSSGKGYDGAVVDDSSAANLFGVPGIAGTAWRTDSDGQAPFSGTSDYIQLPPSAGDELRLGNTDFTLTGWFNWNDLANSQHAHLYSGFHNGVDAGYTAYVFSGTTGYPTTLGFSVREGGVAVDSNLPPGAWNETNWYFFAARYRQSDGQIVAWVVPDDYTWGQRSGSAGTISAAPGPGAGDPLLGRAGGAGSFAADRDEFSMWSRALTNEEVEEIFESGKLGAPLGDILIPEPATLIILGAGALAILGRKVRKS